MSETLDAPQVDEAPAPEAPAVDAADDLRAALGAAFDQHAGETDEEAEARGRDERGRFTRADGAEPEAPVEEQAAEPEAQEKPVEAAPAIPPELAPIAKVLEDYKPLYAAKGVAPQDAVRALFDAEVALRQNPEQAFPALAQAFGFDIMKWAAQRMPQPAQNEQAPAMPADPAYQALQQRLHQLESHLSAQQQRTQQAQSVQVERMVAEFASDPKHAHFSSVEPVMAALIEKGIAKDLPEAYEMACRAHPDVSKTIQQTEASARERAALDAQKKAAAQAKAKAGSVRGSPTVAGFAKPPEDLRGTINAVWDGRFN